MSPKTKLVTVAAVATVVLVVVVVGLASLAPKTKPESVNRPPVPHFRYDVNNLTVTFNASASNDPDGSIVQYSWSFGDGGFGRGVEVVYRYLANGTYNVTLTVTDNNNAKNSTSQDVTVSLQTEVVPEKERPEAVIKVLATDNLTVTVSGAESKAPEGGSIVSYEWSFGDGTNATGVTVTHTFAANGTYNITLTVTDDKGEKDSATVQVSVTSGPSPPPPPPPPPAKLGPPGLIKAIDIHEGKASRNHGLQNSLDHLRLNLDRWLEKHLTP